MATSSAILTPGLVLSRAADKGLTVKILIQGSWLIGRALGHDGTGLMLQFDSNLLVVKMEHISAVVVEGGVSLV